MSASADLNILITKEDAEKEGIAPYEIFDLYSEIKLHDLFPTEAHHLIYKEKCKKYDIEKIRDKFGNQELDIYQIETFDYGEFVTFTNGDIYSSDDLPSYDSEISVIYAKMLLYMGSSSSFKDLSCRTENQKKYSNIRFFDDLIDIYDFDNGLINKKTLEKITLNLNKNHLFIDLNY